MRFGQSSGKFRSHSPRHSLVPMRMGLLMLLLAVVLVLMQQARQPGMWRWLFAPGGQAASDQQIDTRLSEQVPPPSRQGPVVRIARAGEPAAEPEEKKEFFPGVRPELLAKVRDNTIWRGAEHDAFFHLLQLLRQTPEKQLWAKAQRNVSFVQLFRQPEVYRGRLVYLRGRVRRAVWENAPPNKYGIERFALLVLQTDDHPMDPTLVYVLELPPGFSPGLEIDEPVELVGFFYKRKAYLAQDTLRTAPLVLAKTFRWRPPRAAAPAEEFPWQTLLGFAAAAAVVALAVVLMAWKSRPPGARPRIQLTPEEQRQAEEQLEQLARLSETPSDASSEVDESP